MKDAHASFLFVYICLCVYLCICREKCLLHQNWIIKSRVLDVVCCKMFSLLGIAFQSRSSLCSFFLVKCPRGTILLLLFCGRNG